MKNRIEDLRNHLFAQLERLMDCDEKDLDDECKRSEKLVELAKVLIDSGRVELEFFASMESIGNKVEYDKGFFMQKQIAE